MSITRHARGIATAICLLLLVLTAIPAMAERWPDKADTVYASAPKTTLGNNESLRITGGGVAWYKIAAEASSNLTFMLSGEQAARIQMDVYDQNADLLGRAALENGLLSVDVSVAVDCWLYIRLKALSVKGTADLVLMSDPTPTLPELMVPADATPMTLDVAVAGEVASGSFRWFTLNVPAQLKGRTLIIDLEGKKPKPDMDLIMTSMNGIALAASTSESSSERVFTEIKGGGMIALRIHIYEDPASPDNTSEPKNSFTLRASTSEEPPPELSAAAVVPDLTVPDRSGEIPFDRTGSLGAGDPQFAGGEYLDHYTVEAHAGDQIRVTLIGTNFDPYLIVKDPSGEQYVNDDIAEKNRNSQIEMTVRASGELDVTVSSHDGNTSGDYRLTVERISAPPALGIVPRIDTTLTLTVLFNKRDAEQWGMTSSPTALTVSPRGNVIIAAGGNLFDVASHRFLLGSSGQAGDCAYSPTGALLAITGRSLGYYAAGAIKPQVTVPENGMKVVAARNAMYLFGGDRRSGALYLIDPDRGAVKLVDMPLPVGAAAAIGDTLIFSVANDVYRLVRGGTLHLLCRLPGPVITSLAASDNEDVYFTAGRSLYAWKTGTVSLISADIGDIVSWHASGLYVLDAGRRTLMRLEHLP